MLVGPAAKPAKVASVLAGRLGEQAGVSVVVMGCGNPKIQDTRAYSSLSRIRH